MMTEFIRLIQVERIDDIPLLLAQLKKMQVIGLLDEFFPTHGHWKGELSLGEVVAGWIAFIVSEGDHRLSHVQAWAEQHPHTLAACLGRTVRPLDFSDDRLADILDAFSDAEAWGEFETAFSAGLLRVYDLPSDRVRVDSTSAKTYAGVSAEGLFQFGHSKDHRPDLRQVKINLSALDPLGLPLTTSVVSGQTADDPLYVPEIKQVQRCVGRGGKTYIGDCKMGALATRAYVAAGQDSYLCPLAGAQLPSAELETLLKPVFRRKQRLQPVYTPVESGSPRRKKIAEGFECQRILETEIEGQAVRWVERRLVVRSLAQAKQLAESLDKRLAQAVTEIEALTERKQGKKRLVVSELQAAVAKILSHHRVEGLVKVQTHTTTLQIPKRGYGSRPAEVRVETYTRLKAQIDRAAVQQAKQCLGWRVYATNQSGLTLTQVVGAYREQYLLERCFGRLKGKTLSLMPLYLQTDTRVAGLIRLLTIALRLLTLVEFVVRRRLQQDNTEIVGLYPGNAKRATTQPTAELILKAFTGLNLMVLQIEGQVKVILSELTTLQARLLDLLGLSLDVYLHLSQHFLKPALILSEP